MEAMCVVYMDVILAFANVEADVHKILLIVSFFGIYSLQACNWKLVSIKVNSYLY